MTIDFSCTVSVQCIGSTGSIWAAVTDLDSAVVHLSVGESLVDMSKGCECSFSVDDVWV